MPCLFAVAVADPIFQTELEGKGSWFKIEGRTPEARVKKLKSQLSAALVWLLSEVQRKRPRI